MDLEIATGFVFTMIGLVGIATPPTVRKVPTASLAMLIGGGALLVAVFSIGGALGVRRGEAEMVGLHRWMALALLAGGGLTIVAALMNVSALRAFQGLALAANGFFVAVDGLSHGGDHLRTMVAVGLLLASLIDLSMFLSMFLAKEEEIRALRMLVWLLLVSAGVSYAVFGTDAGEHVHPGG